MLNRQMSTAEPKTHTFLSNKGYTDPLEIIIIFVALILPVMLGAELSNYTTTLYTSYLFRIFVCSTFKTTN